MGDFEAKLKKEEIEEKLKLKLLIPDSDRNNDKTPSPRVNI